MADHQRSGRCTHRPGRSQHQALDALYTGLLTRKVNWVLDLDIHNFFDGLSHEWLVKFIEHTRNEKFEVIAMRPGVWSIFQSHDNLPSEAGLT
jgi:hypothetical protein